MLRDASVQPGLWTLYDYCFEGGLDGFSQLRELPTSRAIACGPKSWDSFRSMVELCCGLGGIAIGAARVGVATRLHVDQTKLACDTVKLNGGQALQGDITCPQVQEAIHASLQGRSCIVAAGFPCQPYSTQGNQLGLLDARGWVLHAVLQVAWRTQAVAIVLECVTEVQRHAAVIRVMEEFGTQAGFDLHQTTLDLADVWASRRRRWWGIFIPRELPSFTAQSWLPVPGFQTVGQVMPELPAWPEDEERQLAWTAVEAEYYSDPSFGVDSRKLSFNQAAPTVLHSYGNALRACPCGCRSSGFSDARLISGGLRGFGVFSEELMDVRYLHPKELGLLCSLPELQYPPDCRAALCLIGQLSEPLQATWIFSQIIQWVDVQRQGWSNIQPEHEIAALQFDLVTQRDDGWIVPSVKQGGSLAIHTPEGPVYTRLSGPTTVEQVLAAERGIREPGWKLTLHVGSRPLSLKAWIHVGSRLEPYVLSMQRKRQAKPPQVQRTATVVLLTPCGIECHQVPPGQHWQAFSAQCGCLSAPAIDVLSGRPLLGSHVILTDLVVDVRSPFQPSPSLAGSCGDAFLWQALQWLCAALSQPWDGLLSPSVATFLLHCDPGQGDGAPLQVAEAVLRTDATCWLSIFPVGTHWACLGAVRGPAGLIVECFDGQSGTASSAAQHIGLVLARLLQCPLISFQDRC